MRSVIDDCCSEFDHARKKPGELTTAPAQPADQGELAADSLRSVRRACRAA